LRDVCPLNLEGVNLNKIPEKQLLHTNPYEEFLARLQLAIDKGQMERPITFREKITRYIQYYRVSCEVRLFKTPIVFVEIG